MMGEKRVNKKLMTTFVMILVQLIVSSGAYAYSSFSMPASSAALAGVGSTLRIDAMGNASLSGEVMLLSKAYRVQVVIELLKKYVPESMRDAVYAWYTYEVSSGSVLMSRLEMVDLFFQESQSTVASWSMWGSPSAGIFGAHKLTERGRYLGRMLVYVYDSNMQLVDFAMVYTEERTYDGA